MADQVAAGGRLSPWLRQRRLDAARSYLSGGRVLDIGCGSGLLAQWCATENYLGIEPDEASLLAARAAFPRHRFQPDLPGGGEWDVIVLLAVIEHLPEPHFVLRQLRSLASPKACLVITTPNPWFSWAYRFGAHLGLFSRVADEEHEELLDKNDVEHICEVAGWRLQVSRRFLGGGNQLFVARPMEVST
jgi:2-polyprenyl-3-methyl-5-hydroxy-6-metoxy-1,4-benzoquinol methylase